MEGSAREEQLSLDAEVELHLLRERAARREARVESLLSVRAVHSALLSLERMLCSVDGETGDMQQAVESMRARAHLLTSRLEALEDEAATLQFGEPGRSVLDTKRRIFVLAQRCEARRATLSSWPDATVQRLAQKHDACYDELLQRHTDLEQVRALYDENR